MIEAGGNKDKRIRGTLHLQGAFLLSAVAYWSIMITGVFRAGDGGNVV